MDARAPAGVSTVPRSALVAAVVAHLPTIAAGAAERDRDRVLPRAELDLLSSLGALAVTVPTTHGGPGGGATEAAELLRLLATADPNVAQVPQSHFVYLRLAEIAGSPALQEQLFEDVLGGARVANAQSERTGATVADITTRVRIDDQGWAVVDGEKFYATG
ncbi:MAG: SfnB family sulfur acquisition oxidoreductase, partial [Actinomycetales bacterium]